MFTDLSEPTEESSFPNGAAVVEDPRTDLQRVALDSRANNRGGNGTLDLGQACAFPSQNYREDLLRHMHRMEVPHTQSNHSNKLL